MINLFKVNNRYNYFTLLFSILSALGIGYLSGFLGMNGTIAYEELAKPPLSPPAWVFPVVWTILYFLMGLAAYRVWMKGKQGAKIERGLTLYTEQLVLNFFWSIIFFRLGLFGVAFVELMLLLALIIMAAIEFDKVDKAAGILMIPYVIWVSFAAFLNFGIWALNR